MSSKVNILNAGLFVQCVLIIRFFTLALAVTITNANTRNAQESESRITARHIGRSLDCFVGHEAIKCLQVELLNILDIAVQDNTTWHFGEILAFEKKQQQEDQEKREASAQQERGIHENPNEASYKQLFINKQQHLYGKHVRRHGRAQDIEAETSFSDRLASKFLQLAQARTVRLQLPKTAARAAAAELAGISNAVDVLKPNSNSLSIINTDPNNNNNNNILYIADEENNDKKNKVSADEGTVRVFTGFVDDKVEAISNTGQNFNTKKKKEKKKKEKKKEKKKIKDKDECSLPNNKNPLKGRKKKDKGHKGGLSMGGMAMMAMMAQMFLGKVILIAGAAFVMAKIALLIAILGSLKKGSSGSGGSTDHVIVTSSGGHGHDSGWHRSMPYKLETVIEEPHHHGSPETHHHHHEEEHHSNAEESYHISGSSSEGPYDRIDTTAGQLTLPTNHANQNSLSPNYFNYEISENGNSEKTAAFL